MLSPARTLFFALLAVGCGRPMADSHAPEAPDPAPVPATPAVESASATDDAAPATAERTAAQTISFADDADPEPATQIQGAPKRPPLPRFRLFGTRESDGPK